jgi:hypothetical protein
MAPLCKRNAQLVPLVDNSWLHPWCWLIEATPGSEEEENHFLLVMCYEQVSFVFCLCV